MSPSSSPAPRSRRERPAKPALSHGSIVTAAVRIMRSEGLQRVTVRRLAKELDTGPASLYVYFSGTADLHAAILEEFLGAVDLGPVTDPGDWRDRLASVLVSYTGVLFEHPSLAHSALVVRPSGAHYLGLVEGILSLLHEGGVPDGQAAWGSTCCSRWPPRPPPSTPPATRAPRRARSGTPWPRPCAQHRPTPIPGSPPSATT